MASRDRVARTEVKSPMKGVVKQLKVSTVGGVVKPGEDLIEVVPIEDNMYVEARIRPSDIAFIRPNQEAMVKITAYDFSIYGGLKARVKDISPDTIQDERGESFYLVKLETYDNTFKGNHANLPIIPGMTSSVDILTGRKSVLDYILKPFFKAQENALTER
jgi:adhesin transport system membrane fusion protein